MAKCAPAAIRISAAMRGNRGSTSSAWLELHDCPYARAMGSAVEHALIITVVIIMLLWMSTVAALAFVTVRGVRRLSRAGRAWMHRLVSSGSGSRDIGALRASASATVGSPGWWVAQHDRHRMWRAVSAAEHAVGVTKRAGAPVGNLPTLAAELATAARGVDAVLRASARSRSLMSGARNERARIEAAAADLHRAALESLKVVAEGATDHVVSAARVEVHAMAAGLRAARDASRHPAR
jgi:hypothetical protein